MANLREEIHEKARQLAAERAAKVEGFLKDRVRIVVRSMQDYFDADAKSVPIEVIRTWMNVLSPQLGIGADGNVVVTQEKFPTLTKGAKENATKSTK